MTEASPALSLSPTVALVFRTAVKHWRTCLALTAVYAALSGLVQAVARGSTGIVDPTTLDPSAVAAAGIEIVIAIVSLVAVNVVIQPVTLGALSLVGSGEVYGDEIDTAGIGRVALDRALDAIAAGLVLILVLAVPLLAVGVVSVASVVLGGATTAFGVLVFGFFFVGVPLLYVLVRLSLAIPVVMREGRGPIEALRRSWSLVRGAWWSVFGVVVVALAIGAATVFTSFRSFIGPDTPVDFIVGAVATAVAAAIATALYGIAIGVVYAIRTPEDMRSPDVVASEARAAADIDPPPLTL